MPELFGFAGLSDNASRELGGRFARMLAEETGRKTLLIELTNREGAVSPLRWHLAAWSLNGRFRFRRQVERGADGVDRLVLRMDLGLVRDETWPLITEHLKSHYGAVVFVPGPCTSIPDLVQLLARVDQPILAFGTDPRDWILYQLLAREIRRHNRHRNPNLMALIGVGPAESLRQVRREIERRLQSRFVTDWDDASPGTGAQFRYLCPDWSDWGIRSLVREVTGLRVGLALSSGGAKGLAHIGVIQVLEENGIHIDAVAGCSMGAYVAAVWAHGNSGREMEELARAVEGRWKFLTLIDPVIPPREGFMRGVALRRRLRRTLGDLHFSDLPRPASIVATNMNSLERVIFDRGEVVPAVHASCAIPGVCVPVTFDDETYIDGGISDPLPVDVLHEMGMNRVIAVNTIPTPEYLHDSWTREKRSLRKGRRGFQPLAFLNRHLNYFARGNILDNLLRSVHGAQMRIAEDACRKADLVIRPLSFSARWHEFTQPAKYIALGRQVAEEHLDEIKALIEQPKAHHANRTADKSMGVAA